MDSQKIRFVATRPWLTTGSVSRPGPIGDTLPDWYLTADRFTKDPATGEYLRLPDGGGRIPTWKACPAMFDIMGSGYAYKTPCDIEFYEDSAGHIKVRVLDAQHGGLVTERLPLDRFPPPQGYHAMHFAWTADWAVELPKGYSALYAQPFNRFELPFMTMGGIVDNDNVHQPGSMPFFWRKGVTGVLPAGTPYAQIFPFLREHWVGEYDTSLTQQEMSEKNRASSTRYRQPDGGVYLNEVRVPRNYR